MKYLPLGESDIQASVVGLGAWAIGGGTMWSGQADDEAAIRTIQAGIDAGINLIDTAPAYGWGRSEQLVGRAIRGRRDEVVIATKFGLWWADERGSYFAEIDRKPVRRSLRPDTLAIEIEQSLKNLGVDTIDLYQVHWPATEPDKTPIADTMAALLKLKEQGKIRAIGVSNVSVDELHEYRRCGPIASDQLRYSMLYRAPEADVLPACRQMGLATLTYMSLEQGLLTGKVGLDRAFEPGDIRNSSAWNPWYLPANRPKVLALLAGWSDLTAKYDCSLAQLVIAWTAAQPGVTHVLCGARRVEQILDNAAAGDLVLEAADVQRIRNDVERLGEPATDA